MELKDMLYRLWPIRTIIYNGEKYLTRVKLLGTPWVSIYFHVFHRPDPDRALHDHPWAWASSLILRGWYKEVLEFSEQHAEWEGYGDHLYTKVYYRTQWQFRTFDGATFHRVAELSKPGKVWTLFISGPRVREWGFRDISGVKWPHKSVKKIPWYTYLVDNDFETQEAVDRQRRKHAR